MTSLRPNSYVLYTTEDHRPPWPAVICLEDMFPQGIQRSQNATYDVPVLLLHKNECRWVLPGQLQSPGDMVCPEEKAREHPGLQDAYATMLNAVVDEFTLEYWKIVIDTSYEGVDQKAYADQHPGKNQDPDIKLAITASLGDQGTGEKRPSPTQEPSPPSSLKRQKITPEVLAASFSSGACRQTLPSPYSSSASTCSSSSQASSHQSNTGNKMFRLSLESQGIQTVSCEDESIGSPPNSSGRLDDPISLPGTGEKHDEEDEMLNPGFIRFLIGPNAEAFDIPMDAYLRQDDLSKVAPKMPCGKNGWSIWKPNFVNIDPEHFKPVAAFLSSGNFHGPRHDEQGNELDEEGIKIATLEVCLKAWGVALQLPYHPVMELIVQKVRNVQPFPLMAILSFANGVYQTAEEPFFEADTAMRKILSAFIAHHFWDYNNAVRKEFTKILQTLPELRQHVFHRMSKQARKEFEEERSV